MERGDTDCCRPFGVLRNYAWTCPAAGTICGHKYVGWKCSVFWYQQGLTGMYYRVRGAQHLRERLGSLECIVFLVVAIVVHPSFQAPVTLFFFSPIKTGFELGPFYFHVFYKASIFTFRARDTAGSENICDVPCVCLFLDGSGLSNRS